MRYLNSVPIRVLLLMIAVGISIGISLIQSNAYPDGMKYNNLAMRNEQVKDAFSRSDLIVLGTVTNVRNYTPTDGGYGYDIAVSEVIKGNPIAQCSVRMGGWAYTIRFAPGEKVLLFLKPSNISFIKERFTLVQNAHQKPLAFRVDNGKIREVDANSQSGWEGLSLEEITKK